VPAVRRDRRIPVLGGILGGLDLSEIYPELGYALLVCATETKSLSDINSYVTALGDAMQSAVRAA